MTGSKEIANGNEYEDSNQRGSILKGESQMKTKKHFLRVFALLPLFLILFASQSHARYLDIKGEKQEKTKWCWAACSQAIFHYYLKGNFDQCAIAEWARQQNPSLFGAVNCCDDTNAKWGCNQVNLTTGAPGSLSDILKNYKYQTGKKMNIEGIWSANTTWQNLQNKLKGNHESWNSLKDEMDAERPMIIWQQRPPGVGDNNHFILVEGLNESSTPNDTSDDVVYYIQPELDSPKQTKAFENDFFYSVNKYQALWAFYITTEPPPVRLALAYTVDQFKCMFDPAGPPICLPHIGKVTGMTLTNRNSDMHPAPWDGFGIASAIDFILEHVKEDGSIWEGLNKTYETSSAITALVATRDPDHADVIENAKNWLVNSQWDEDCVWGSFDDSDPRYGGFGEGDTADLSTTQSALTALKAAGLSDDSALWGKAKFFVKRCQNSDGGFQYMPMESLAGPPGTSDGSMTAAGVLSLRECGVSERHPMIGAAINWLKVYEEGSFNGNPGMPDSRMFQYYYYMTVAKALTMCHVEELNGINWYESLSEQLAALQQDDGSWANTLSGYGDEDVPEIATGFALLALQAKTLPPLDASMSIRLPANADWTVYDPLDRHARIGDITIPGATSEEDPAGKPIVKLAVLQPGAYRLALKGTAAGAYSITVNGYRDSQLTSSKAFDGTITPGEMQETDVLVSSTTGPLTIDVEKPQTVLPFRIDSVELRDPWGDPVIARGKRDALVIMMNYTISEDLVPCKAIGIFKAFGKKVRDRGKHSKPGTYSMTTSLIPGDLRKLGPKNVKCILKVLKDGQLVGKDKLISRVNIVE